jgi:hypothetical protein
MKSSNRCRWGLAFFLALAPSGVILAGAQQARAGEEDPESLIRQGVALRKRGDDAKALGYFQRAYDIARTPRTAAQLGLVLLALGKYLEAEVRLGQALDVTDPWVEAHTAALESARATARGQLGKIELVGAPSDATVEATGRPALKLPSDNAIWVSPGMARLRIEAPGFEAMTREVSVAQGAKTRVRITMAKLAPEHPPADKPPTETRRKTEPALASSSRAGASTPGLGVSGGPAAGGGSSADDRETHRHLRIAAIVGAGAGVAMGVTGFLLRNVATQKLNAINSDATATPPRPYNPSNGNYQTFDGLGLGLMVAGGATVGASVITYILNRDSGDAAATHERTTVSFAGGDGRFGVLLSGRY